MNRVVAAAIFDRGRVLAARPVRPAHLAGGWEFAGGKVELGESDEVALRRELREELGIEIIVGPLIDVARDGVFELFLYSAELTGDEPRPLDDHDDLRWVDAAEFAALPWLPIDRAVLPAVGRWLDQRRGERGVGSSHGVA